jgi:transcriptional regulator with XRE-family HTH domain
VAEPAHRHARRGAVLTPRPSPCLRTSKRSADLAKERAAEEGTQAQLAETMGITPGRVSQIERGELSTIEAIARYVQALGGRLDLVANFTDHTLTVTTPDATCWRRMILAHR